MDWVLTAIGVAIVLEVLLDIFHTLAHPGAQGLLSRTLLTSIWRWSRHSQLSGPLAFRTDEQTSSLAATLGYAAELGTAGLASDHLEVRHAGRLLLLALDDLATMMDVKFLGTGDTTAAILAAYAVDHGH
jgi:hypothetical protein